MEPEKPPKSASFSNFLTPRAIKITAWIVGVILILLVLWQNWNPVETPILFLTIRMPRALFVLLVLSTGFVLGLLTPGLLKRKRKGK